MNTRFRNLIGKQHGTNVLVICNELRCLGRLYLETLPTL